MFILSLILSHIQGSRFNTWKNIYDSRSRVVVADGGGSFNEQSVLAKGDWYASHYSPPTHIILISCTELPSQPMLDVRERRRRCIATCHQILKFLVDLPKDPYRWPRYLSREAQRLMCDLREFPDDLREAVRDLRCRTLRSLRTDALSPQDKHRLLCKQCILRRQNSKITSHKL